jgi:formyltetrahydrofolate deformylase
MSKTAILLIDCPDRKGIVVTIINFLVQRYDVNILNADQHQDVEAALFFMRVEFATGASNFDEPTFRAAFDPSPASSA